jgi:Flp pilus assembly protein TadD
VIAPLMMARLLQIALLLPALAACAALGLPAGQDAAEPAPASAKTLYTDAVRTLITQGQYYAAVAHIQEDRRAHGDSVELRLLEAHARRNLGQVSTATALYQSVLRSQPGDAAAAEAHQGLGRLAAARDPAMAMRELREAVRLAPANADIRNDYGYVLLQARRFADARTELATASELAPGDLRARNNLLILLWASGDDTAAQQLAQRSAIEPQLMAQLRQQAQTLKAAPPTSGNPAASRSATGKSA